MYTRTCLHDLRQGQTIRIGDRHALVVYVHVGEVSTVAILRLDGRTRFLLGADCEVVEVRDS